MTVKNNYSLFLLNDMIASIRGARYIILIDVIKFFLSMTGNYEKLTQIHNNQSPRSKILQNRVHEILQFTSIRPKTNE